LAEVLVPTQAVPNDFTVPVRIKAEKGKTAENHKGRKYKSKISEDKDKP
jgi:hypothetical protein